LSENVWYYLRGEEYSAQIDYFVQSIKSQRLTGQNTFRSALQVDRLVSMILSEGIAAPAAPAFVAPRPRGFLGAVAGLLSRSN
jgi:hypothetical protein